jgi:hypothetical protein
MPQLFFIAIFDLFFLSAHFVYVPGLPCCYVFIYVCTFYYFCFLPLGVLSRLFPSLSCSVLYPYPLCIPFPLNLVTFCSLRWHILARLGSELIWGNGKFRGRAHCTTLCGKGGIVKACVVTWEFRKRLAFVIQMWFWPEVSIKLKNAEGF